MEVILQYASLLAQKEIHSNKFQTIRLCELGRVPSSAVLEFGSMLDSILWDVYPSFRFLKQQKCYVRWYLALIFLSRSWQMLTVSVQAAARGRTRWPIRCCGRFCFECIWDLRRIL